MKFWAKIELKAFYWALRGRELELADLQFIEEKSPAYLPSLKAKRTARKAELVKSIDILERGITAAHEKLTK